MFSLKSLTIRDGNKGRHGVLYSQHLGDTSPAPSPPSRLVLRARPFTARLPCPVGLPAPEGIRRVVQAAWLRGDGVPIAQTTCAETRVARREAARQGHRWGALSARRDAGAALICGALEGFDRRKLRGTQLVHGHRTADPAGADPWLAVSGGLRLAIRPQA